MRHTIVIEAPDNYRPEVVERGVINAIERAEQLGQVPLKVIEYHYEQITQPE